MKKLLLVMLTVTLSLASLAGIKTNFPDHWANRFDNYHAPLKKIDITVSTGGYTIRIVGTVTYNPLTGNATIHATLTITGNGANIELPYNYSGPLNSGKGPNTYSYDTKNILAEDRQAVEVIVSHIYLPADKDASKIKVQ